MSRMALALALALGHPVGQPLQPASWRSCEKKGAIATPYRVVKGHLGPRVAWGDGVAYGVA